MKPEDQLMLPELDTESNVFDDRRSERLALTMLLSQPTEARPFYELIQLNARLAEIERAFAIEHARRVIGQMSRIDFHVHQVNRAYLKEIYSERVIALTGRIEKTAGLSICRHSLYEQVETEAIQLCYRAFPTPARAGAAQARRRSAVVLEGDRVSAGSVLPGPEPTVGPDLAEAGADHQGAASTVGGGERLDLHVEQQFDRAADGCVGGAIIKPDLVGNGEDGDLLRYRAVDWTQRSERSADGVSDVVREGGGSLPDRALTGRCGDDPDRDESGARGRTEAAARNGGVR
jgi:hypothetical protein